MLLAPATNLLVPFMAPQWSRARDAGSGGTDADLIGWWKSDEGSGTTAINSGTGSGNGALTNGPTYTTGQIGSNALLFDGSDDYVVTGSNAPNLAPAFTYAGWIKPNFASSGGGGNAVFDCTNGSNRIYVRWEGPSLGFYIDSTGAAFRSNAMTFSANTWHHLAITASATANTGIVYFDGAAVTTNIVANGSFDNTSGFPIYLGRGVVNGYYWHGELDDMRVYQRVLTALEIAALYAYR